MTIGQVDANLRRFYAEARKKDGEMYSKKSLLGFRHAIERFLNQPPYSRNVKMSSDPRFNRSNEMLDAQLVQMKRSGKENTKHKPIIEDEDLVKLKTSEAISLKSPLSLLRNVWFHVVLFFCRRGREGQRQLTKSSFKFDIDGAGRSFITMAHDEASKNHPGGVKDVQSHEKCARMYETESLNDGYKALKLYLSKLNPQSPVFFQYPKRNWAPTDEVWYDNKPLGVNKLDNMMKEISQAAQLSLAFTPTTQSGLQQSLSGPTLVCQIVILWRFLATEMNKVCRTTTRGHPRHNCTTAAKSCLLVWSTTRSTVLSVLPHQLSTLSHHFS